MPIRGTLPIRAPLAPVAAHPMIADLAALELVAVLATAAWQRGRQSLWMWAGSEALANASAQQWGLRTALRRRENRRASEGSARAQGIRELRAALR
jgi:hypothetical protein